MNRSNDDFKLLCQLYVVLKLLHDGVLHAAGENFHELDKISCPVRKISIKDTEGTIEFHRDIDIKIFRPNTEKIFAKLSVLELKRYLELIFKEIKNFITNSFSKIVISELLSKIGLSALKIQPRQSSDNITIIQDLESGFRSYLTFSIWPTFGESKNLLKDDGIIDFIYEVRNLDINDENLKDLVEKISQYECFNNKTIRLKAFGGMFRFKKIENDIFESNLRLIDSLLPEYLAELLLNSYTLDISNGKELIEFIYDDSFEKLYLPLSKQIIEYKIRIFLMTLISGMPINAVWKGNLDDSKGFIILKENGDLLGFHLYNQEDFQEFLFKNAEFGFRNDKGLHDNYFFIRDDKLYFDLGLELIAIPSDIKYNS